MTPSTQAKALGCKSLAQVEKVSGASKRTLINWFSNKPELFKIVCLGVATHENTNPIPTN